MSLREKNNNNKLNRLAAYNDELAEQVVQQEILQQLVWIRLCLNEHNCRQHKYIYKKKNNKIGLFIE